MHTISDVFFWRSVFALVIIAALLLGFGAWRLAQWIRRDRAELGAHKRAVATIALEQRA